MNKEKELGAKATFYEAQYRKTLEKFYTNEKKFYELVKKHNRLKDEYHDVKTCNIRLLLFLGVSMLLNVLLIMLN